MVTLLKLVYCIHILYVPPFELNHIYIYIYIFILNTYIYKLYQKYLFN